MIKKFEFPIYQQRQKQNDLKVVITEIYKENESLLFFSTKAFYHHNCT